MSETDSFIDEVTEEVQRDRLFKAMRKYGWIAILGVVLVVGGTAFNEFRKSATAADSAARGDAILDALESDEEEDRAAALDALASQDDAGVVVKLLAADVNDAGAADVLRAIASDPDATDRIRGLAQLKLAALPTDIPVQDRIDLLTPLAAPGAIYRDVAVEYLVAAHLDAGNTDDAIALLQAHIEDAGTSAAQGQRMTEVLVALGVAPQLAEDTEPAIDGQ